MAPLGRYHPAKVVWHFLDPQFDELIQSSRCRQTERTSGTNVSWAEIDRRAVDRAFFVPIYNPKKQRHDFGTDREPTDSTLRKYGPCSTNSGYSSGTKIEDAAPDT